MTYCSTTTASATRAAKAARKPDPFFVSFPAPSAKQHLCAQALVLLGLTSQDAAPPREAPLVSIVLTDAFISGSRTPLTKKYGKQVLVLKVRDDFLTLQKVLLPQGHFYSPHLIKRREIHLDEAHLHSTLSAWDSMPTLSRLMIAGSAMAGPDTTCFSVNFSERRQRELGRDPAQAFRRLRNDLVKLNAMGDVVASLEWDSNGRLHLHGMLASKACVKEIKTVLKRLGGRTENIRFRNLFQVKAKAASNTIGWSLYMAKNFVGQPSEAVDPLIYLSNSAKRRAVRHLEELKELTKTKLGQAPQWRGRATVYGSPIAPPPSSSPGATLH